MLHSFTFTAHRKLLFIAGLVLTLSVLASAAVISMPKAHAATPGCDSDVIIYCGFSTPSDFINKARSNDSGNGHHDLQTIFANYGLSTADYDRFASTAQPATIFRDGRVVVNGQTVATGGQNVGREASTQGPGAYPITIGGTTYFGNSNGRTYIKDLPGFVLFDSQGKMQFATLKLCGNPIFGTVVNTSASCNALQSTPVAGQLNTYSFTASANSTGNASITRFVYDFGDGSPTVTTTNGSQAVSHAYTKGGNFTAKVTVYASVPGNPNLQLPVVGTCTKQIAVTIPFYNCIELTGAILDKAKFQYSFTARANFGNGATFISADFDFGDSTSQKGVQPNGTSVSVTHAFAGANKYNISATLHFNVNGAAVTAPTCMATVSAEQPPTPTCKPGVPIGSPECSPCQFDSSLPADSPKCVPQVLPDTGAGNTIALFGAIVAGGFLVYRQLLFRRHKAAFLAADSGTSVLPLADPLNNDAPLAETPYAKPKTNRFRRKRQF